MDTQKMAPAISVTANEEISVNNEHGDNNINPIALKMKGNYQKNVSTAAKLTLAITPVTTNNTLESNQEQLHIDCEDLYSIKGIFAWESIEKYRIPYIIRVINGVKLKFVSVRMAETQLLNNYLTYLHEDIFTCKSVRSHFITDNEAKLLNEINYHTDFVFGKEMFSVEKEFIVLLEDVHELYKFLEVCLKTLLSNIHTGRKQNCGFIHINSESIVPYCIKNNQKYVPLFFFDGETEKLQHLTIKLENWNLAYLKFCCKVQGISNEYFIDESWTVISLDDIKKYYSTETNFEEYWPPQKTVKQLLTNQNSIHINTSGAWIRAPSEVVLANNTIPHTITASAPAIPHTIIAAAPAIPHTITASAPAIPQSLLITMDTHQNEWPTNQRVQSYSFQAQSPSTITTLDNSILTRNQNIAAQCYNADSTVSQGSSLINGVRHVVPPPPLIRVFNTAPAIGNSVSYSEAATSSQCETTAYNSMTNSDVISDSNQMQNSYSHSAINNSQSQAQLIQQQQYRQQSITSQQIQLPYSRQSVHGHPTDRQPRNDLRNSGTIVNSEATEVIDKPLPPSNSVPPTDSTVSQGSSLINGVRHVVPPPPLIRVFNTAPAIGNSVSYSEAATSSQCETTAYNSMTNSDVISDSNQMQNSYSHSAINNSQSQAQLIQQQQYRQQSITSQQIQLPYSRQSVHGHPTDIQPRNDLRNAGTIVNSEATEVIDTPLPPSSSVPPTVQEPSISPSVGWELTKIPERIWGNDTNITPYQIRKTTLQGKTIYSINANPYVYSDVLIKLEDLVKIVLPSWTVARCAFILQKYSKITLFCVNSEQLGELWRKGLVSSINPEDTPMAMLQDIIHWLNTGIGLLKLSHPLQPPNSLMQNAYQSRSNRPPPPPYPKNNYHK